MSDRADIAYIFKGKDEQWRVTIKAPNGEPIFTSESYKSRQSAESLVDEHYPQAQKLWREP